MTVRLINEDYDSEDEYSVQYPANKLISFMLYKVENNSSTLTKTSYTKLTNAYGYATINMAYDPGDYELEIRFGGDEEYEETSIIIQVNVSGTKEVYEPTITKTKSKPVKKTAKKFGLTLLGKLPLNPAISKAVDAGAIEELEGSWLDGAADYIENQVLVDDDDEEIIMKPE